MCQESHQTYMRLRGARCWVVTAFAMKWYWLCDCDVIVTKVYILGREQGESDLKQHLERSFSKWWYRSSQSGPQVCLLQVRKCLLLDLFTHFQWKQIFHLTQFWTMSICILWKLPGLILYLGSQRSLSSKIFITYFKVIFSTQVSYVHCRKIRK